MNKKTSIILLIISIVIGIVIGIQIRTISKNQSIKTDEGVLRARELALELKKATEERERQKEEIEKLNNAIQQYEKEHMDTDDTTKFLYSELEYYRKLACLTEVEGKGIIININDSIESERKISSIVDNPEIILRIVSVLNSSGAEAISINEQRMSSYSGIERAGNFLEINGVSITSPITIKAMGDKDTMIPALNIKTGVIDSLRNYHFDVVISEHDSIVIEKIDIINDFKYAESIKKWKAINL